MLSSTHMESTTKDPDTGVAKIWLREHGDADRLSAKASTSLKLGYFRESGGKDQLFIAQQCHR